MNAMIMKRDKDGLPPARNELPKTKGMTLQFAVPVYHYSLYWRSWSRFLGFYDGQYVEVDISKHDKMNEIKLGRLRTHTTTFEKFPKDLVTTELPEDVVNGMIVDLGADLTTYFIGKLLLEHIDWYAYRQHSEKSPGGGIPLAKVLHTSKRATMPIALEAGERSP